MAGENPVLGVGAGNYQANIGMYFRAIPRPGGQAGKAEPDSQNQYLVLASSVGWPGVVFLLALFLGCGAAAASACNRLPPGPERGWALGLFGSILAIAISGNWSPFLIRGLGLPLAFLLCLAVHTARSQPATD
jgi:O-antigen ligase